MPHLKVKINLFLLISILGICLLGCSEPPPKMEDLKGRWAAIKKEAYTLGGGEVVGFKIEFFEDHTVELPSGKGTWTILADGRVKIDMGKGLLIMHGALKKGLLTITMPEDQGKVIFKKIS